MTVDRILGDHSVRPRFGQADAVYDDVDDVLALLVEDWRAVDRMDLTIDTHAGKAVTAGLQEDILELTLAVAGDRREDEPLATGCLREDLIDNLFRGLRADASTTFGTVGLTDPGVQDAQVVVDLGDGANGRPRILGCRLLFNGNGRRETDDCVNGRLLLVSQELARIAGEAFNVPSLTLGVQGVESE